jgi:rod shape-determining protein MreC
VGERATTILLVALLLLQLILLAAQVPDRRIEGPLLRGSGLRVLAPALRAVEGAGDLGRAIRLAWRDREALRLENRVLREEVAALRHARAEQREVEQEVRRLRRALDYQPPEARSVVLADVVFSDHHSWLRTLLIRSSDDALVENAPVVTHQGLVGRVIETDGEYARVQLVTDRSSSVGAMIERTRRQGIARGLSEDKLLLDYVPELADVRLGDRVITAGIDGIYPRGLPIGVVVAIESLSEIFYRIEVAPAIDLARLDEVFVLAPLTPSELLATDTSAAPR